MKSNIRETNHLALRLFSPSPEINVLNDLTTTVLTLDCSYLLLENIISTLMDKGEINNSRTDNTHQLNP